MHHHFGRTHEVLDHLHLHSRWMELGGVLRPIHPKDVNNAPAPLF